jgi:hypothetical protein
MVTVCEPAAGRGRAPVTGTPAGPQSESATTEVLPAWPLVVMLVGFPVAWVLGLSAFAPIALAGVMVALLVRKGRCHVLPGIARLLVLVAWACVCGLMVDTGGRLVGWALRIATLATVAVVVVYVANAPERLPRGRVVDALTAVWVTVVIGGWLALVAPELSFTTPVGRLLPSDLLGNALVHDMLVPTMSEIQRPWGAPEPFVRPAAPFPYANGWGAAIVLLTPVAVAALIGTRSRAVRWTLSGLLLASVAPAVASSNRGMLLGLAVSAAYVGLRLAVRRRVGPLLVLGGCAAAAAVLGARLGAFTRIAERQAYSSSTQGRASLYAETWQRTRESPLFGWGGPRPSLHHEVSVGTQGYLWSVMFSYGLVGLLLFAAFLVGAILRTWRVVDDGALLLHSVLVGAVAIVGFYGLDVMQWLTVGVVAALLLRERAARMAATPRRVTDVVVVT